jgi:hypothetical protein
MPIRQKVPPDLRVLIDFVNDVNPNVPNVAYTQAAPPIWLDVTSKVRQGGFSLRRGRERPLDRNEAGTATVVFDNFDREFDPESLDSFGLVMTMRHIRIEAKLTRISQAFKVGASRVGGSHLVGGGPSFLYESIFDGYIESWTLDYPGLGVMAKDILPGTGFFDYSYPESLMNLALNYLPYAGRVGTNSWNSYNEGDRDIASTSNPYTSAGKSKYILKLGAFQGQPARTACDAIAEADGGNFFFNRNGKAAYRDHDWPLQPAGKIHVAVEWPSPDGREKFVDVARALDETLIYNWVYLIGPDPIPPPGAGGAVYAILEDLASQARYLRREWPVREIGIVNQWDLQDRAENILLRYREPQVYLSKLDLSNIVTNWREILRADLWDMITVDVTLPNGDVVSQRSMIEGIEISSPSSNIWNVVWWLSLPAFPNLLSDDARGFEGIDGDGTTDGWTAETHCTLLAQDTQVEQVRHRTGHFDPTPTYTYDLRLIYAAQGAWVLQLEATGAGNVAAISPAVPVESRRPYLGKAKVRLVHFGQAGGVPSETNPSTDVPPATRMVHAEFDWFDASHVYMSTTAGTDRQMSINAPITLWDEVKVDAVPPDGAVEVKMRLKSTGTGKTGLYVDDVTIKRGA